MIAGAKGRRSATCSSMWNDVPGSSDVKVSSGAPARANRVSAQLARHGPAARDAAWPPGDISLPTVPKSGRANQKNKQREDMMRTSANKLAALLLGAWSGSVAGNAAGVGPELSVAQHHGDHPVRARQRQRHHRAHRARAGRQAARAGHRHRKPRRAPAAPSASAQAARATPDGYTILFHSASFSAAYVTHKTLPYDTFNDFIAVGRGRHLSRACSWPRRPRATRPPPI